MNLINEESATYEGVVDEERNVALVQWSQFIEHDLVKTVFEVMSMFSNGHHFYFQLECINLWVNFDFPQKKNK